MSEIRWCDPGGHAFSKNDQGREEYASTKRLGDGEERTRIDICGACVKSNAMGIQTLGLPAERAAVDSSVDDVVAR
jgi:hypothetical protein